MNSTTNQGREGARLTLVQTPEGHEGMNPTETQERLVTLAQATKLEREEWEYLGTADLLIDAQDRERTAALWLWLRGINEGDAEAERARHEVLSDAGLMVALNLPAVRFLEWFRHADWDCFDETDETGCDAWAWGLMDRARMGIERMGAAAEHCALRVSAE